MKKLKGLFLFIIFSISLLASNNDYTVMKNRMLEFSNSIPYEKLVLTASEKEANIEKRTTAANKAVDVVNQLISNEKYFDNIALNKRGFESRKFLNNALTILKAYNTEGTKYYKNPESKELIVKVFDIISKKGYVVFDEELPTEPSKYAKILGNWWDWEIGIPKTITEAFVIGEDVFPEDLKLKLLNQTKVFQPDPRYSGASKYSKYFTQPVYRETTGANRMDTSLISFQRGIALKDDEEVKNAINAAFEVGSYMDETRAKFIEMSKNSEEPIKSREKDYDGFYKDGSFLQHQKVPYAGTYGEVLLNGLGQINFMIAKTSFDKENENINNIYDSIINGFNWFFINGGVNDSVSGRAISREKSSEITRVTGLAGSIALLSEGAPEDYRLKLQGIIKRLENENLVSSHIESTGHAIKKSIMKSIQDDKTIIPFKPSGVKVFPNMDRTVQFGTKDGKIVLSMHSKRISNFETMNDENVMGWHVGDGMTYIYTKASDAFVEYWPTVDKYMLPGTTESVSTKRKVVLNPKNKYKETEGSRQYVNISPKTFVGGVSNGKVATSVMDFTSWNDKTTAKKSWFFLGDSMIALATDIESYDGEIVTTIDNRILNDKIEVLINGKKMKKETEKVTKKDIVSFYNSETKENIGYRILDNHTAKVRVKNYSGTWNEIGNGKSKDKIEKTYFQEYIEHGYNPANESYAYQVFPMFTLDQIKNYDSKQVHILANNSKVQAVRYKEDILANFYEETKLENIEVKTSLSLIYEKTKDGAVLTIADPTQELENTTIILDGNYNVEEDSSIEVTKDGKQTILKIELKGIYSKTIKLNK